MLRAGVLALGGGTSEQTKSHRTSRPFVSLGARLARATFAPDLLLTDGVARIVTATGQVEGWMPYRRVFDVVWSGRRHVMMGASQP